MMRTAFLSIAALVALTTGAGTADAQIRARRHAVVTQPADGVVVGPNASAAIMPAPPSLAPSARPGYVGPFLAPGLVTGNGYNFYPGLPYNNYAGYRYWR